MSSNNYIKNYSVGQIRLDAPYAHFLYQLPLLSFSDVQHAIDLSLVYQSKMTDNIFGIAEDNIFGIAEGYKLSLQKKLIIPENSVNPTHYMGDNGSITELFTYGSSGFEVYAFNDNSKRILRKTSSGFTLENPDNSKEFFSVSGNILNVIDKYGNTLLTYEYETINSKEVLTRVIYREALTVSNATHKRVFDLHYSSTAQLTQIQYVFNGNEYYSINFSYDGSKMTVDHFSEVSYTLKKEDNIFSAYSHDTGSDYSESVDHWQKTTCEHSDYGSLTVKSFIGSKLVDEVIYHPIANIADDKCEVWDVESFSGVRKRILFDGDFPKYSYEVTNVSTTSAPHYDTKFSHTNNSYYYGKVSYYNNNDVIGSQSYNSGLFMTLGTDNKTWSTGLESGAGLTGLFTLSGWIKAPTTNLSCDFKVYDQIIATATPFTVKNYCAGIWTYFTFVFYGENFRDINVYTDCSSYGLEMKDFRVTYQETDLLPEDTTKPFINAEDVLINSAGDVIPFRDVSFAYFKAGSFVTINEYVSGGDVLKYQLNSKRTDAVRDEIYYNDVKNIITSATDLRVRYNGTDLNVSNYIVGKRYDSKSKIYVIKLITNPTEAGAWLKKQTIYNGYVTSTELFDRYMNLLSSAKDGVTTAYTRNAVGLVTKQTTNGLITEASYDETFSKLLWSKDEFGTKTTYTINEAFGVVTNSKVTDNQNATVMEIEEAFDDDFTDRESITFRKGSASTSHTFTYENDKLKTVTDGSLGYSFSYNHHYTHNSTDSDGNAVSDSSDLVGISKCGSLIEQNVYKDDQRKVTTAYPSLASPLYTVVQRLDKYGRIEQIDGIVKNTYDALPFYSEYEDGEFGTVGDSGETARLAESHDLTTGKKTKFGYDSNLLKVACVFNSSGTKLTTESYVYDDINRMISDEFTYATDKTVRSDISYNTSTTNANPDNRISSYTYNVNNSPKAITTNVYNTDSFKRLKSKSATVGSATYTKGINYTKTRITQVTDTKGSTNLHNVSYTYDALGRITDEVDSVNTSFNNHYIYDSFGRLIQENNKSLDKTFVYEYNESGNIISAKAYNYTTESVDGVNPISTDSYTYDSTVKDRLTVFKGDAITYDSMGYPIKLVDGSTTYTYTWTKGKLTGFSKFSSIGGRHSYTYTYDAYGRRIKKLYTFFPGAQVSVVYTSRVTTNYTYDLSGRLIKESATEVYSDLSNSTRESVYLYDENSIVGVDFTQNGSTSTYYFDRNIKGDVIGIYNASGTQIAKYSYDSWGNAKLTTYSTNNFSGYNPIRYRGYYFDAESGFYFLNTRYYNPAWRRFISPDNTAYLDHDTPNGLNLYAYCNNDPVNYSDPSGNSVIGVLVGAFIWGAIVGAAVSVGTQLIENEGSWEEINPWVVLNDAIFGGISGILSVSGWPVFFVAPLNAWLSTMQILINAGITGEEINPNEILFTGLLTFGISFIPMPSIDAKTLSKTYASAKLRLLSKSKLEYIKGMIEFFENPALIALVYAASTPAFSFITSQGAKYWEEFFYGTGKYDLP